MRIRIQRRRNIVVFRVPKPSTAEAGSEQTSEPSWSLEELLSRVTDETLHEEVDTGPPVGREIW
jgi:hypothetical protein